VLQTEAGKKKISKKTKKVAIVGAGLGGLAAASLLAKEGFEVDIWEKNDTIGGKASELKIDGYRWDRGPSFVTMPWIFEELFKNCEQNMSDYLQLAPLPVAMRYFWNDYTEATFYFELEKTKQAICQELGESPEVVDKYFQKIEQIYKLSYSPIIEQPISLLTYTNPQFLKAGLQIGKMQPFDTLASFHQKIFSNPKTIQIFNRWAAYVYSNPFVLPAALSSIAYVEQALGLYFPTGGIHSISKAIAQLAEKMGVNIHLNTAINRIVPEDKDFRLIFENGATQKADVLISNVDIQTTYHKLLGKRLPYQPKSPSSSYIIFYWGMQASFEQLNVHNIFFPDKLQDEFVQQYEENVVPDEPMIYINITSKASPGDAPEGCENWTVILSVPNATTSENINWKYETERLKEYVLRTIEHRLNEPNLKQKIVAETVMTPTDIYNWTGSWGGGICGMQLRSLTDALQRPRIQSQDIKHLYFAGGSVNPGCGMPLVVLSGQHCADLIKKQYN
jgi:phytoene desaturase